MSDVTIRRGTPADLEQVMAIAQASDTVAHWRPSDYRQIFESKRLLLVAASQNGIVGFLSAHNIVGEWEVENVAVSAGRRRRGIGEQLLRALITEASNSDAAFILLEVRESNSGAKRLYERCGFQPSGRRRNYYSNPPEDAILYRFLCNAETLEKC